MKWLAGHLESTVAAAHFLVFVQTPCLNGDSIVDQEIWRNVAVRLVTHVAKLKGTQVVVHRSFGIVHT
jgi:hypothetical protein